MIPFYVFYSMFGFQRVGDLAWAAGDSRARGFLIGATAGRTTLNGEGLQHEDGHSHLLASVVPNCRAYDPTYAYELGGDRPRGPAADGRGAGGRLLLPHGDERELPAARDPGRGRGGDPPRHLPAPRGKRETVSACSCSAPARSCARCSRAGSFSRRDFGIASDVWSVTSFTELRREGLEVERWNRLHPTEEPRTSWVESSLAGRGGPFVAATDYMRTFADQIRPFVPGRYAVLGTDGFGRSDYRVKLRQLLRGRPASRRRDGAEGARRRGRRRARRWCRTRSSGTGSTRTPRRPGSADASDTNDPQGRSGTRFGGARVLNGHWAARRARRYL